MNAKDGRAETEQESRESGTKALCGDDDEKKRNRECYHCEALEDNNLQRSLEHQESKEEGGRKGKKEASTHPNLRL